MVPFFVHHGAEPSTERSLLNIALHTLFVGHDTLLPPLVLLQDHVLRLELQLK